MPISGTSAAMKPWISEIDSTPSWPCSALMRSTKERIGSRLVGSTSIMRQSKVEITGLISPRAAARPRSTTCSPRSTKSVCGNSRKKARMSAGATRFGVRWLCGSSSEAIRTSGPDDVADAFEKIAFAIVIALRHHRAMQAEDDAVDRQRRLQLAEDLVAQRLIGLPLHQAAGLGPGGGAFDHGEALPSRAPAQHDHRRRAQRRRFRMLARPGVERHLESRPVGRHRRERVGFGRERGGEDAHESSVVNSGYLTAPSASPLTR